MDNLRRIARDMALYSDSRCISEDTLDSYKILLESTYCELLVLETTAQLSKHQREVCGLVSAIHCKNEHVNSTMLATVILVAESLEWILC